MYRNIDELREAANKLTVDADAPLTNHEIYIYEWQYKALGGFRNRLWEAIVKADSDNLWRLSLGFEYEIVAYLAYIGNAGWWENVQAKLVKFGRIAIA